MKARKKSKYRKRYLFSVVLSVALHLLVFLAIGSVILYPSVPQTGSVEKTYTVGLHYKPVTNSKSLFIAQKAGKGEKSTSWSFFQPSKLLRNVTKTFSPLRKKDAQQLLEEKMKLAQELKDKEKELERLKKMQDQFVSEKGQNEVLDFVGKNFSEQDFEPREEVAIDEFSWEDFTIHNIIRIDNPEGYEITFVNRAGQMVKRVFVDKEARHFDTIYNVFKMGKKSKLFQNVLRYTLKSVPRYIK